MLDRFAHAVTTRPRTALALTLLFAAGMTFCARDVRLDNNFAQLFSTDDEAAALRAHFRETFGADDGLLVAALLPEDPSDPRFTTLLEDLSATLEGDADVLRVYSATQSSVLLDTEDGATIAPAFGALSAFEGDFDARVNLATDDSLGGARVVSTDGEVFLVAAELDASIDSYERLVEPAARFERTVDDAIRASGIPVERHFAGIAETRLGAISSMQGDLLMLSPLTTAVLALFLLFFVRRFAGVAVSMLAIGVTIAATAGVIGLRGDDLNQLTIIYPVLLMVVVVANAVHMLHRFRLEHDAGRTRAEAARICASHVVRASFLTSATTAIGFGSLILADMEVLHGFGAYLAAGVMISFGVVSVVLPACLSLFGERMVPTRPAVVYEDPEMAPPPPSPRLEAMVRFLTRPAVAWSVTLGGLAALAALAWVGTTVQYDYRLSDNLYPGHPVAVGNEVVDSRMSGIVPLEVSLHGAPGAFRDPANLARMEQLGRYMHEQLGVPTPVSLGALVARLHESFGGTRTVPRDPDAIPQLLLVAEMSPDHILEQLVTDDYAEARMRTSTPDTGAADIVEVTRMVDARAAELFSGTGIQARLTGEAPVAYEGMNRLSQELLESVGVAIFFVILAIGVAFRSPRVALASVLPNVLPLAIGLGVYAFTGRVVDPLPGVAFCIGIGIAVDDTVHLLARHREEMARGVPYREAIVRSVVGLRGALVSSSVVLAMGFLILMLSDFDMNRALGWLGALLIGLALVCDLVFTPAMLAVLAPRGAHRRATDPHVEARPVEA